MQDDELVISLSGIARALKQHLVWLIIVPLVAAVLTLGFVVFCTEDVYTAQAKLYALTSYVDAQGFIRYDMSTSLSFTSDYQKLIETPGVINDTCVKMGWDKWPENIEVEVSAASGTRIIDLDVTSKDAIQSMNTANTLAEVFVEYVGGLMRDDSISIASPAVLPEEPSNGGRIKYVILVYFGVLFILAAGAIAVRAVNDPIDSDENIQKTMNVNLLSMIKGYKPEMDEFLEEQRYKKMTLLNAVNEQTRESIKKLSLNLQFANTSENLNVLTVTSTTPSEGKSSVALMLGCQYAKEGSRVLLVDMDYRSPMLGKYLGQRSDMDLMSYLRNSATLEDIVQQTRIRNLSFVDTRHSVSMVMNKRALSNLDRFLNEAKAHFDLVIFDTPPLGMFVDAATIAAKSDGTIIIVADGKVRRRDLQNVIEQLNNVNANILGVAFNFVRRTQSDYYGRYYRYGKQHESERKAVQKRRPADNEE